MPFSSKYDAALLQHKTLDMYVERILQARMNKMGRMHEDVTEIHAALERVHRCMEGRNEPSRVQLLVPKLTFGDLPAIAEEH